MTINPNKTTAPPTQGVSQPNPNGRNPKHTPHLGVTMSQTQAAQIAQTLIPSPDPTLTRAIRTKLQGKGQREKKRREAGELLLGWLQQNGEFLRSEDNDIFYLYWAERCLYKLDTNRWHAWLYSLTGANPSGKDFSYFVADCKTAAMLSNKRKVVRLAFWDKDSKTLRVSRFDGTVYCLDGQTIIEEVNGESVIFNDDPSYQPYDPDYSKPGTFTWMADAYFDYSEAAKSDPMLAKAEQECYRLALRVWELVIFFTELTPTRPALTIVGEKGSGKSMTLRRFLRALFGTNAELSGVPDKPDGFTAAAAASHIVAIDNLDEFYGWMRDKISRLTTGAMDEYRQYYTSHEVGRIHYRCWLAFTSRNPATLQRDDLADRLVLIPCQRIPEQDLKAERAFLDAVDQVRNAWWGSILMTLNTIVAAIRGGWLSSKSVLRMADWESLGRVIAKIYNQEKTWDNFIENLKQNQSDLLLEGNLIVEGIEQWLDAPPAKALIASNEGREISTRDLHTEMETLLFPGIKTSADWPKRLDTFGLKLKHMNRELKKVFDCETTKRGSRKTVWWFWHKGNKPASWQIPSVP